MSGVQKVIEEHNQGRLQKTWRDYQYIQEWFEAPQA